MKNDGPITLKDIIGGLFVILLLVASAFIFMGVFSFFGDGVKSLLHWIDSPVVAITVTLGLIFFAGVFFSLAKTAEFGFNIRRFVNDLKNHFKK